MCKFTHLMRRGPEFLESLGSDLYRKSECFVQVFNLKMEDIILLKEVQRKLSDKETNNRLVSFETQVLIQENGFRLESLQGLLRNAQHIQSYTGKGEGMCDHASCSRSSCFPKQTIVLILELNVVVVVFFQILMLCRRFLKWLQNQ